MTMEELRKLKPQIQALARQYFIDPESIRVFGSTARGEAGSASDVDFLVRTLPGCSLFKIGGMYGALRKLLGLNVDIVTEHSINPYLKETILKTARPL